MELWTMSDQELTRFEVLQRVSDRRMTGGQAAQVLGLSRRQVYRLLRTLRRDGATGLISRKRGKPGNHQLVSGLGEKAMLLVRERYADFGPTLACEKLREWHGIRLSVETLRKLMVEAGLWIPRALRERGVHQPRMRRACFGELVQIDGCEHAWFEDRAPMCTLLVYVDDATSRMAMARFVASESTVSYMQATRDYVLLHGKPLAFYSDRHVVFSVNSGEQVEGEGITQFCRALGQLGIELICALSPQAKGRVERAHLTLQDRLVKEMRLHGIVGIEQGNAFLPAFLEAYNRRFGRVAREPVDVHRPLGSRDRLEDIFSVQNRRKLSRNLTFRYCNTVYAVDPTEANLKLRNRTVTVMAQLDGTLRVRYRNADLRFVKDYNRPVRAAPPKRATYKDLTAIMNRLTPGSGPFVDLSIEAGTEA